MLFTSPVYSQTSGSIAGITYAHGRSGMVTKARRKPTNPNSFRQAAIRQIMASLMPMWGQTLDDDQRAAWNLYGSNVPWSNALGQTIFLTGHQHFLRCNASRLQAGIALLTAAPIIYDLGTYTLPTFTIVGAFPPIQIGFDNTDHWASNAGGYMLIYNGRPVSPGRKFYRHPWRYVGKIIGDDGFPPGSPASFIATWPWPVGNLVWLYVRIIQTDGRMSPKITLGPETILAGGEAAMIGDDEPDPEPDDGDDQ